VGRRGRSRRRSRRRIWSRRVVEEEEEDCAQQEEETMILGGVGGRLVISTPSALGVGTEGEAEEEDREEAQEEDREEEGSEDWVEEEVDEGSSVDGEDNIGWNEPASIENARGLSRHLEEEMKVEVKEEDSGEVSATLGMTSVGSATGLATYEEDEEDMEEKEMQMEEEEEERHEEMMAMDNEGREMLNWLQCDRCTALLVAYKTFPITCWPLAFCPRQQEIGCILQGKQSKLAWARRLWKGSNGTDRELEQRQHARPAPPTHPSSDNKHLIPQAPSYNVPDSALLFSRPAPHSTSLNRLALHLTVEPHLLPLPRYSISALPPPNASLSHQLRQAAYCRLIRQAPP
jgi:hypothetical protein